jgi:hypothetical protein
MAFTAVLAAVRLLRPHIFWWAPQVRRRRKQRPYGGLRVDVGAFTGEAPLSSEGAWEREADATSRSIRMRCGSLGTGKSGMLAERADTPARGFSWSPRRCGLHCGIRRCHSCGSGGSKRLRRRRVFVRLLDDLFVDLVSARVLRLQLEVRKGVSFPADERGREGTGGGGGRGACGRAEA